MNKIKSFVKQFTAIVTGDSATAQAEKALRQADSALKTHIAILVGDTISKEDAVSGAEEQLALATVNNGRPITNRDGYVQTLLDCKNNLTNAQEALKKHNAKIDFLTAQQDGLDAEVEAEA